MCYRAGIWRNAGTVVVRHGVWGVLAQELYTPRGVSPSHLSPQMYYFQRLMKHPEMKGLAQGPSLREVEPEFQPMSVWLRGCAFL